MSSDAKANTLPKWSYILLAVLLVPFGVGLIWAIVSKGNVPDAVTVIAAVCIFTAIALIVHLAWPRRSMWFAHLAAFVLFFILFLFLHAYGETEAGAFAFVMAFMSLLTLALMANLAYKDEGWGERNARQRKSVSSWTAAPHVLQVVPRLRNIGRNRPRHGGPDLGQPWNPDMHVHDHLPNSALEQVH